LTRSPFILYNDPELIRPLSRRFRRSNIRTHILKDLSSLENLTGLIFRGPLDRAHNYQRACRKRTDFRIYDGDERDFLDYPSMSGVTSVGANLAPRAWEKVTRSSLHLQGTSAVYPDSLRQMWKLGQHLRDLMDLYEQEPAAVVKGVLWKAGLIETPLCFSAKPDVGEEVDRVEEVLAAAGTPQP
jgi:dihydrodipicolinate synthase/N-acetylneuraminate lyase